MHVFRKPRESDVRRLLGEVGLPASDLTPQHFEHFFGCGTEAAATGVVGLEIYGQDALLRSLAVEERARGRGCGQALVAEAERYARGHGVQRLWLLTTSAAKFFENLGYKRTAREAAPEGIRTTKEFAALCAVSAEFMSKQLAP